MWSKAHIHWRGTIDPWVWASSLGEEEKRLLLWGPGSIRSASIPSTARNKIEHASDTQLVWEPNFTRPPVGKGDALRLEQDADDVENGSRAVTMNAMLHDTELAYKAAGKYGVTYGYYVIEGPVMTFDERPEKPKKADFKGKYADDDFKWAEIDYQNSLREWNPIRIHAPRPDTVLLDPSERQPKSGIKHRRMYRKDIVDMLTSLHDRSRKPSQLLTKAEMGKWIGDSDYELMEIDELWTPAEHLMVYNDIPLFSETNAYGFVPFNHGFSGFGMQKINDNQNDPYYLAQGLLEPVLDSIKTEAQATSAKQNALIERSYLRIMTRGDTAELAEQLAQEDAIIEGDEREVSFLRYPDVERSLFQISNDSKNDIEMGTFSNVVSGGRSVGVSTVGQHAMQSTTALKKFAALNMQMNMSATIVGRNTLKLVDRYGEAINIGGHVLDPKQIHHDYTITAEFQAFDPILQLQEREMGLREAQVKMISNETYRETALRIKDETLEKSRLMKEAVRGSEAYMAIIAKEVAKADGMEDALESARKEQEATSAPGAMPTPGQGPEISPAAGGGGARAMRQALDNDTANPPRTPLPQGNLQ